MSGIPTAKPALLEYTFHCTPLEELAGLSVMENTPSQCLADNWERTWFFRRAATLHVQTVLSQWIELGLQAVETLVTPG